jgi:predicted CopG family antitoxin
MGVKTLTITEEAYELLSREKKGKESFSEVIKRLARERGELKDSFGAWTMTDEEEERIFSALKKDWRNATLAIRTTADLAGSGKKHASVSEMKHLLDRMRAKDL